MSTRENQDLLIRNARVLTCDGRGTVAEAVAVTDGRIAYVGGGAVAADHARPGATVLDARGKVVTPGFIDSHCHVLWVGALLSLMSIDLYECSTFDDIKCAVSDHAAANPDLPFVMCMGWNRGQVPGGVPDRSMLDPVVKDRPVILWSECAHMGWVNTKALEVMSQRNPERFGQLLPVKDTDTGTLSGEFLTFWFINPLDFYSLEELRVDLRERMLEGMSKALRDAVSVGVTTMDDVMIHDNFIPMVLEFKRRGLLDAARVRCTYYVNHYSRDDFDGLASYLDGFSRLDAEHSDDHLVIGRSVKMGMDGVASNHTAFMLEPYSDDPADRGHASWSPEEFERAAAIATDRGLQVCTHACGDAAIRRVVDCYERVMAANPGADLRMRVDHNSHPDPGDIERMGRLGLYAAMQPAHFYGSEVLERSLGMERVRHFQPFKSVAEAGADLSFGSDWCAGPINPVYGIIIAATRLNYKGKRDWGPGEAMKPEEVIRHWTLNSARAIGMEKELGSLERGKLGDLVVWKSNPLKMASWWFLLTHKLEIGKLDDLVEATVVGGRVVHGRSR